jgi:hypothetical protein
MNVGHGSEANSNAKKNTSSVSELRTVTRTTLARKKVGTVNNMGTCPHKTYFTYRTANIANHMMADAIPFDKG